MWEEEGLLKRPPLSLFLPPSLSTWNIFFSLSISLFLTNRLLTFSFLSWYILLLSPSKSVHLYSYFSLSLSLSLSILDGYWTDRKHSNTRNIFWLLALSCSLSVSLFRQEKKYTFFVSLNFCGLTFTLAHNCSALTNGKKTES